MQDNPEGPCHCNKQTPELKIKCISKNGSDRGRWKQIQTLKVVKEEN